MSYADLSLLMTKVMAGLVLLFPIVIASILSNNYQEIRKGKTFLGKRFINYRFWKSDLSHRVITFRVWRVGEDERERQRMGGLGFHFYWSPDWRPKMLRSDS